MDPVQQKLAIRMWNDAVALASHEVQIEALAAENARLKAAATEAAPSPEVDED
ncbi:hypothetical protein QE375_001937 [Microbacterium foliorum]|uniref:Uncharacterized protein n=1 Tax=Microbacterium foliorum TaxID=104336 RepID=A0ABU1HQQ5_9MICO|nr:hypothetical protein [Microbacterium foliorum]MDR6142383.1 hypothetical protein [Microbacterium foliorum]